MIVKIAIAVFIIAIIVRFIHVERRRRAILREAWEDARGPAAQQEVDLSAAIHREGLLCWLSVAFKCEKHAELRMSWPLIKPTSKECYDAIRALILAQPKVMTQEWVDKWAQKIDRLYVGNRNAVLFMLEELGIGVEP